MTDTDACSSRCVIPCLRPLAFGAKHASECFPCTVFHLAGKNLLARESFFFFHPYKNSLIIVFLGFSYVDKVS